MCCCRYNLAGNMLLLCGFGNLPGTMEFWTTTVEEGKTERRLVCHMRAPNTTLCRWAPDSQHLFTATTAPRLRIDNGCVARINVMR